MKTWLILKLLMLGFVTKQKLADTNSKRCKENEKKRRTPTRMGHPWERGWAGDKP
jgi:hypothetical protein